MLCADGFFLCLGGGVLRTRTYRLEVRFTEGELAKLSRDAAKSGLSKGAYVRAVMAGVDIKEAPTRDVFQLIREVRRVGYNLEQVLRVANTRGLLDVPEMRLVLQKIRTVERLIVETYAMRAD